MESFSTKLLIKSTKQSVMLRTELDLALIIINLVKYFNH